MHYVTMQQLLIYQNYRLSCSIVTNMEIKINLKIRKQAMCVYWNNAWNFEWCRFKLFYHRSFNFRLFLFVLIMSLLKAWHVNSVIYITVFKFFALKPLTIKRGILLQAVIIYYIIQIIFREILLKCWILVNWLIFRVYKKNLFIYC